MKLGTAVLPQKLQFKADTATDRIGKGTSKIDDYLIGDGVFTIKEENDKIIIVLCAWTRRKEREMIHLLNSRKSTEIHVHDKGYAYGEIRGEEIEIAPFAEI